MVNAQNLDNLINFPMTSSSNSTYIISKDKTVFVFMCNLSSLIKLRIFVIDNRSPTPKKSVKRITGKRNMLSTSYNNQIQTFII